MEESKRFKRAFSIIMEHGLLITVIILSSLLYFYHLDYTTLGSWDEAWYGSIAREMLKSGDIIHLNWNGNPFYDHPHMGYWLMAISYKIFGISEFSTRVTSAFLGVLSAILLYLIGKKISKEKVVGFAAALILGTCVWYVIRVRSGNLDSLFVFFYTLSIYTALKARNYMQWFPIVMISFGALMLTKTLVGISALPIIIFILLPQFFQLRKNFLWILGGLSAFCMLVLPWYWIHYISYPDFIQHHFLDIGTRSKTFDSYFNLEYELPLFYLHMGIRKWYYLWLVTVAYFIVTFRFIKKNVLILLLWNLVVLYPFLTTDQTHIWHLIPVYIPIALIISYGFWDGGMMVIKLIDYLKIPFVKKLDAYRSWILKGIYLGAILYIVFLQVNIFYPEVIPTNRYTPDDVDISQRVAKYKSTIYLDDDYLPLAVYYSGRFMNQMAYEPEERKTLVNLFKSEKEPFVAITRSWALNNLRENNIEYIVLEQNNSFSIVKKP